MADLMPRRRTADEHKGVGGELRGRRRIAAAGLHDLNRQLSDERQRKRTADDPARHPHEL